MKRPLAIFCLFCVAGIFFEYSTTYPTTENLQTYAVAYAVNAGKSVPPNTFSQDGCSLFPNTLLWHDLRPACLEHDMEYWAGGTEEERLQADLALRENIRHTGPLGPVLATPMYYAVRWFGDSWLTKLIGANWGYGYNL